MPDAEAREAEANVVIVGGGVGPATLAIEGENLGEEGGKYKHHFWAFYFLQLRFNIISVLCYLKFSSKNASRCISKTKMTFYEWDTVL